MDDCNPQYSPIDIMIIMVGWGLLNIMIILWLYYDYNDYIMIIIPNIMIIIPNIMIIMIILWFNGMIEGFWIRPSVIPRKSPERFLSASASDVTTQPRKIASSNGGVNGVSKIDQ